VAIPRFLAKQFALPHGLLGGLVGQLMARINEPTTAALIDRLAPALDQAEAVLEIGYGPGVGIALVAQRLRAVGRVSGIDPSAVMLSQAGGRVRRYAERVELRQGVAECLPWSDHTFDAVFSANSAQLWPQLEQAVRETARVLKPSGQLGLALHQRAVRADGTFVDKAFFEALNKTLIAAGYQNLRAEQAPVRGGYATFVIATASDQ
jgi:ubiquinone/menaquinone biosynthesis C-methylase UbiE